MKMIFCGLSRSASGSLGFSEACPLFAFVMSARMKCRKRGNGAGKAVQGFMISNAFQEVDTNPCIGKYQGRAVSGKSPFPPSLFLQDQTCT
jgi:hypothetical protein